MQIIGFNFEKIQVARKGQPKGKLELKSNINIKAITQEKIEIMKDRPALKFDFEFTVDYKPNVAEIIFQGFVLGLLDKEKTREVVKKWKTKKIPDEARVPLFNFILTKCNLKALHFEEEFGLPPHIPLPRVRADEKGQKGLNYTG